MAKMIDKKPSFNGEGKFWECIKSYLPDNVVVYNNREINGREFDFCLFIENVGILVVEVKGWLSSKIKVHGVDNIIVEGYEEPQGSPKKQARAYRFALLNKIATKYNVSPLVFDMVCYPFITKDEYKVSRLDVISEEQFTIFKEDLADSDMLMKKLQMAYSSVKNIPHASFDTELMVRLRQDWEPNYTDSIIHGEIASNPYSILSICPDALCEENLDLICSEYFAGVKRVIFLGDYETYTRLIAKLDDEFRKHNIEPNGNVLEIGYKYGFKFSEKVSKAFNLEVYFFESLSDIIDKKYDVIEGRFEDLPEIQELLMSLSECCGFNYQQYLVEHSDPEKNTLVEAGAGTGKTFSMVSRVAFLCNKQINAISNIADEIAMVTFTNEAALNMKKRLKQMFFNYYVLTSDPQYLKHIEDVERADISTIHSFALKILKKEPLYTGLGTNLVITSNEFLRTQLYDEYLSEFLREKESENPNFKFEIPVPLYELKKKIIQIADKLLAKSVDLTTIKKSEMGVSTGNILPYFNEIIEKVVIPAEKEYSEMIHNQNAIDLKECLILLSQILKKMDNKIEFLKIRHLFIDEFQDTDDVQIYVFQMLQKLISADCRLFVVGDLKQSIYRFRGARLSAFEQIKQGSLFEWERHHLMVNYRTDLRLLKLYDSIFENIAEDGYLPYSGEDRLIGRVNTDERDDDIYTVIPCHAKEESNRMGSVLSVVQDRIEKIHNLIAYRKSENLPSLSLAERTIAVLVRSNWQVENVVEASRAAGIQIEVKSGGDLFQLESTLDLYRLVSALLNSTNPTYLVNLLHSNYLNVSVDYSKYKGLDGDELSKELIRVLDEYLEFKVYKTWDMIVSEAYTQPALFVIKELFDALQPWKKYSKNRSDQRYYIANYEYLIERIIRYSETDKLTLNQISEYLRINVVTRQQQLAREIETDNDEVKIICTTVHKSKGLEYGTVILPYTDEEISDIQKVKLDANYTQNKLSYTVLFENKLRETNSNYDGLMELAEQISEEARILYVALTRAIRNCIWIKNIDKNANISWSTLLEG